MSSTAATIIIRGRIGSSPEMRFTKEGQVVTNLSLAVDQGYGDNKRTEWVRVAIWGEKQAEAANTWLSKGDLVTVYSESFRINAYAAQDGSIRGQLEINARRVDYIITKRGPNEPPQVDESGDIPF